MADPLAGPHLRERLSLTPQRRVARFVLRRLAAGAAVVVAASVLTFALVYAAPGEPGSVLAGPYADQEERAAIRAAYGLDDPLASQLAGYAGRALRGDFGRSLLTHEGVMASVAGRLDTTLPLLLASFLIAVAGGVGLGWLAARRRGGTLDRAAVALAAGGAAAPPFAVGILLVAVLGVGLGWLPVLGEGEGLAGRAEHLVLPVLTLAIGGVATMARVTRDGVADVLASDHVAFARARGVDERRIDRAVARGAGARVAAAGGVTFLMLVASAMLVEVLYGIDGAASLYVRAAIARDIPTVQGMTVVLSVLVVCVNLAADLVAMALDPRVRARALRR